MTQVRYILRLVTILLVMSGVLSGAFAACGAFEYGETAKCCAGEQCVSESISTTTESGPQVPQQHPIKKTCTDCTILCKVFDRSMVPAQAVVVSFVLPESSVRFEHVSSFAPLNHLSGVFKPPKA